MEPLFILAVNLRVYVWEKTHRNDRLRDAIQLAMLREQRTLSAEPNRMRQRKRKIQNERDGFTGKRRPSRFNHARALLCVNEDYWGDDPIFNGLGFERMFGVTSDIAKKMVEVCCRNEPRVFNADGWSGKGIHAHVKVLCVMKVVRFGTSMIAFSDYFQMGESTMRQACHAFFRAITSDDELLGTCLSSMTRADAEKAVLLHKSKHGVDGMVLSLDCCHFKWKNCPMAWKGQFEGKEGEPTIVLEAAVDHDLHTWHAAFGYPGTQNDIVIWQRSPLHEVLENGVWSTTIDPAEEFEIGGERFRKLWILVDGIYPPIARFVKTISEPGTEDESTFAQWQEGARKDVERAFGVMQSKFRGVTRKIELWHVDEIKNMALGCIILHNMMVRHRQMLGTEEDEVLYAIDEATRNKLHLEINPDTETEEVLAELGLTEAPPAHQAEEEKTEVEIEMEHRLAAKRFQHLNDPHENLRLRNAIISELNN